MKGLYFKRFVKDRDEALLSLDKKQILAFYKKYGLPYSKRDKVFWATVYKCIYHINDSTEKQKAEAEAWLIENGFTTEMWSRKMTTQEAFEIIKNEMPYESSVINEALKTVENAVDKQIPKKPIINKESINHVSYKIYMCPCCKKQIIKKINGDFFVGRVPYHCDNCGQDIDWSDDNG